MAYHLETQGRTIDLDVTTGPENTIVHIGTQSHTLAVERISDHEIMMTVNGQQIPAWISSGPGGKTIIVNGRHFQVLDRDATAPSGTSAPGAMPDQGAGALTPPMPAVVIGVPKAEGDWVEKGETVILLSAMKMEAYITAPYSGRITAIRAAEGDKVMPGDILADIEPEEAS